MTRPLLTTLEVCARLRRSRWWVYELVKRGTLPAVRTSPGGRLLFDIDKVTAALHDGRPEGRP